MVSTFVLKDIAHLQGKMHRLTRKKKLPAQKQRWEPPDILRMAEKRLHDVRKNGTAADQQRVSYLVTELEKFHFPTMLPRGLTHQDIKPENILVANGHVFGVIDFDNCYEGALLHDLTTSLIWLCGKNGRLNTTCIRTYVTAYSDERPLTFSEKNAFADAIRWRLLREAVIWDRISAGILNPDTTASQRKEAQRVSDRFLAMFTNAPLQFHV
jgi:Ser/Thr protein kinase RdoA (MazF antagonist)